VSQKRKSTGWPARCGEVFGTEVLWKAHRKLCLKCKELRAIARIESGKRADISKLKEARQKWLKSRPEHKSNMEGIARWRRENPSEYKKNQAKASRAMKKWRSEHPEEVRTISARLIELASQWREQHPEEFRQNYEQLSQLGNIWRMNNPERFAEITSQLVAASKKGQWQVHSNLERGALKFLGKDFQFDFVTDWGKSIDIHLNQEILIEVDGYWHFFNEKEPSKLENVQFRDWLTNEYALLSDKTLIRLSADCFTNRGNVKDIWKNTIKTLVSSQQRGVFCLGKLYEFVPWASDKYTILKSPILLTTSC
jgi:hypothetical protein